MGFFAVGNVCNPIYQQALTACAQGMIGATAIEEWMSDRKLKSATSQKKKKEKGQRHRQQAENVAQFI